MWRPATQTSGTNDQPLGNRRRFGAPPGEEGGGQQQQPYGNYPPQHQQQQHQQQNYGPPAPPPGQYGGDRGGGGHGGYNNAPPPPSYDRGREGGGGYGGGMGGGGAGGPPQEYRGGAGGGGYGGSPMDRGREQHQQPPMEQKREREEERAPAEDPGSPLVATCLGRTKQRSRALQHLAITSTLPSSDERPTHSLPILLSFSLSHLPWCVSHAIALAPTFSVGLVAIDAPRKRRSRWGEEKPVQSSSLPTAILGANVSQQELDQYAVRMRVEEINNKLKSGDIVPPERQRSPSPPPTYDAHGRRTNTREVRYRRKLEDERVKLVDKALKLDPAFRPPNEYHVQKRNTKPQDKVYIPVKEFPEINFFGLLVGPRGNSLKTMERESGAKISIRGKGSVKEGKGRPENVADDAQDELHCLITADDPEKVRACVNLINSVIATAASTPEAQNHHKTNQLRELAALNGTLRDDENQVCLNCGNLGHKKWDCPEQRNFSAGITCHNCGSVGHMARDCRTPRGQAPGPNNGGGPPGGGKFDAEYANLMNELGEGGGTAVTATRGMISGAGGDAGSPDRASGAVGGTRSPWAAGGGGGQDQPPREPRLAPWRDPANWITPNQRSSMQQPQGYSGYPGYAQPYGQGQQHGGGPQQGGYPQQQQQQVRNQAPWAQQQPPQSSPTAAAPTSSVYEDYYASLAAAGAGGNPESGAPIP